jgi:hypothetical protein
VRCEGRKWGIRHKGAKIREMRKGEKLKRGREVRVFAICDARCCTPPPVFNFSSPTRAQLSQITSRKLLKTVVS